MKNKAIVTLSFFMLLFMICGPVYSAIPPTERKALIALYNSTNGDNWDNKARWKKPPLAADGFAMPGTEKDWYGITVEGDHVSEISMRYNELRGPIPAELGNLSNLWYLDLFSNHLTLIPPELGNLSKLWHLNLASNHLTRIPPELGNLSKLWYLDLASNQLASIPPGLGNLSNLERLYLESNQLTGIPPELSNLSKLEWLSLSSNQLTRIPPELSNLPNLKVLDLSSNRLWGSIIPELSNLSKLEELYLNSNQLTGSIPPELGDLSNLGKLDLSGNWLWGSIPSQLGNLSNLHYLYLNFNQLTGSIPPELGNLSNLEELYLNSNQLRGNIPPNITDLKELGVCDFRWNSLYTDDESVRDFLDSKQEGGNWVNTQTIAPIGVSARVISGTSIEVSWKPIAYTDDEGSYKIFYSRTPGGPYTSFVTTQSKYDYRWEVRGLEPLTHYYFVVQTRTEAHKKNPNPLESEFSEEVSAATPVSDKIISGRVAKKTGEGVKDVSLIFLPSHEFETTDTSGHYKHAVETGWSGSVKPSKIGYRFEPQETIFENVITHQTGINFTAYPIPLALSGRVTSFENEGIEGVTLTFAPQSGANETEITDHQGYYYHPVPYGWTGRVTPSKNSILFSPPHRDYYPPGVIGIKDHEDYRLSVSLYLHVSRKQDSTVIIRKEYGEIELIVSLEDIPSTYIQKFIILRKESTGTFQPNCEFTFQELNNNRFTYADKYLDKGKTYIYKAKAFDTKGNVIAESKEKTI